ncbi:CDP-diacylglycerol--glycerol-3-phosphate 3-phosphatidyltransferase [Cryobacterium lactosi]|uniref:CDP-diacylglycerol--glycerol-3-phosphate 3-phosphatidyltransferase n=1 Tax=Cryobacterium lactosi TaxID=1259202 RepID=A0A4R9BWE8_9MICO|nr:CDP-diacylglycerol--glycerol-3-phosphate 3-phosphatidyltransferase [Cryobacterium lactosi]TFD92650.1 CDP-diacylglycerol--glycerol-3-phosphate 3-phosphatidyltransferase [Cryobacterium lactosi]
MVTPSTPAKTSNWNLPNIITIVRILLAPVFFWMLLADNGADGALRWWAAVLFIVAIATDGVDGAIARRYNLVTDLGKLLDPIADKILTGAALIGLSILLELPWWVTIVILVREVGITVFRFVMLRDRVIPASRGGKLKTIAQSVAISLALLPLWLILGDWVNWVNTITMTIALLLTVYTGIEYLVAARRENQHAKPTQS